MRSRLVLLSACLLALAIPAKASAALTVGISENQPTMFSDPLFTSIGIKHARIVVAWDVVAKGGFDLDRVTSYISAAQASGRGAAGGVRAHARGRLALRPEEVLQDRGLQAADGQAVRDGDQGLPGRASPT